MAAAVGFLFGVPELAGVGVALGIVNLGVIVTETVRLARILSDALDIVANAIALKPMHGAPVAAEASEQAA